MKIKNYRKLKDNRYEVILDDGTKLKLYDDIIVKHNLLGKENIDDKFLKEIDKDNEDATAYYKALKYISIKLRSAKEIREYLYKNNIDPINIENTILRLEKDGLLNKDIYIQAFINDQLNLSNNGYYKILNILESHFFNEEDILKYLDEIEEVEWLEKIEKLIKKKYQSNKKYSVNKLKEKIIYDLCNLGYKKEWIVNVLNSMNFENDNDLLQKEYEKVKRKLESKFKDSELKYQIRSKLLAKGFSFDDINEIME